MKHLQELEIGLKIIDFSYNHDGGAGGKVTEQESVRSPRELENRYKTEEERGRVRMRARAGDKRIMFHAVRKRISM